MNELPDNKSELPPEQRARRDRIDAHGIDPGARHLGEIPLHLSAIGKLMPVRIRAKRAVGDALDPILPIADEQKLPAYDGP